MVVLTWQLPYTPKVKDKREQSLKGMHVPGMASWR